MTEQNERSEAEARERMAIRPSDGATNADADLLVIERPAPGVAKTIDPSGYAMVKFGFGLGDAKVVVLYDDVMLVFPDGGRVIMPAFMMQMMLAESPNLTLQNILIDTQTVTALPGDARLVDPLPQLTLRDNGKPPETLPETQNAATVVQMPGAQNFANTAAPAPRPAPAFEGIGEGDALQESNARFAKRGRLDDVQSSSAKGDGLPADPVVKAASFTSTTQSSEPSKVVEAPTTNPTAPVITSSGGGDLANLALFENSTSVVRVIATDAETPSSLTYSIVGGQDGDKFAINSKTGQLFFVSKPDFETPDSSLSNNNYKVVVGVSDGSKMDTQSINVSVLNVNEAPVGANLSSSNVAENVANGTVVGTVTAVDPDMGGSHSFAFLPGGDAGGRFLINATTGTITVNQGNLIDFETSAQHVVIVRVTDQGGLTYEKSFIINVTDGSDAPVITSNGGGTSAVTSMAENTSLVTTVTSVDPDLADTVTYSILGGADAGLFTINPVTGALSFITPPNFEVPTDFDGNNIYEVIVRASDGTLVDTQAISITVNDANDPPVITSDGAGPAAALTMAENSSGTITTVAATDIDVGASISYAIVGGADAGKFVINSTTGELRFLNPTQNFEAPDDADADGVYDVIVQALDGQGGTDNQTISVTLTDANDVPIITSDGGGPSAAKFSAEGSVAVTTVAASDADAGASITYAITGGLDAGLFTINTTTGVVTFIAPPDFEAPADSNGDNVYQLVVTASDGLGGQDSQTISVTVGNQNDAPVITSNGGGPLAAISVTENGTAVTTVTASDADAGATQSYSIVGGADAGKFTINSTTGVLTFVAAPNFEAPTDVGGDNIYDVVVEVTDGTITDSQSIAVTVTNQNETPSITSNGGGTTASITMAENVAAVTTVTGTDPDAATTLAYSIVGGADMALFTINAAGELSFSNAPDFETKADAGADNIYDVRVRISDGLGGLDEQDIAITITDANDAPDITSNGGGLTASVGILENATAVTTVVASDQDPASTITYSISGGADAAKFTINSVTGVLEFISGPDFEAPTDVGGNNTYDVQVSASDGVGGITTQDIAVVVSNQNDTPPSITSDGGGMSAVISMGENISIVTTVVGNDPDPFATLSYSITGGADAGKFTINSVTGALSFISAPDFETKADAGANNIYDVQVQVSDGTYTDTQDIAVTITNQNEAPTITSNGAGPGAALSIVENGIAVTTVTSTDPDAGASKTFSIFGGADAGMFTINASTGVLSFITAPDFETKADAGANNVYDVIVRVSDGLGGIDDQAIAVTITNVNEAPSITSNGGGPSTAIAITENSTAVTTVIGTDPDASTTLSYSIVGGADAGKFTINSVSGALNFITAPDFETKADVGANNIYDVIVRASDGTLFSDQAIAVTINNQNEAPTITSNGAGSSAAISIAENGTAVTTVTASDPDAGSTQSYSIFGGADAGMFTINAMTGVLSFISAPDFETKLDVGANNIYDVTVRVSDGLGGIDDQAIAVTITNVNDNPPVITSNGSGVSAAISIAENGTAVTTVTSTDADIGASKTFSISGGADAGKFSINASTGVLSFISAPDFETKADVGANNIYDVQVRVSDGTFTDTQDIAVTITDQNEAPVITSNGAGSSAAINVTENSTAVTTVTSTDQDAGATKTFSISGGADSSKFTINATTGVLSFITAPNFEAPTDVGANNVYDVIVRVSDGTLTDTQAIAVTVINQNEAPVITSNGGGNNASITINENLSAVTTVTSTDPDAGATKAFSIVGGADAGKFTINATTGALSFITAPDFEIPTDAGLNNIYDVRVQVSDGTLTDVQDIAVTVANVGGVLTGDSGDNTLIGTVEEDNISGLDGNDIIDGGFGADSLFGGDGDDTLSGGAGNDYLDGGNGNDNLYSGAGDATIFGRAGNDRIYVDTTAISSTNSTIDGGADYDEVALSGAGTLTGATLALYLDGIEKIDFTGAGVVANLANFTAAQAIGIMSVSGPGNTLTLDLDGNDIFSVAAGQHFTQVGNLYTFFNEPGLINEIARVNII
jgi:Cadherin domain/RTX calcium-binding nonapeptide repeat (4 copies)